MPLIAMSTVPESTPRERGATYGPYFLCGWKVRSALPLPELAAWSCSTRREADTACVELLLEDSSADSKEQFGYGLGVDGQFVLRLPGLAVFRVSPDARRVTLNPAPDADSKLLRAHFYGSVVAIVCFLRGLLPLHGACVRSGETAVIFTGDSGAGKSTLAAAFARNGCSVLCDDVCAISFASQETPRVWPAFPRLKLLPDAIETFALNPNTLYTQAARGEKGHFVLSQDKPAEVCTAQPVAAIYLLSGDAAERVVIERLRGAAAFLSLRSQVHRSNMGAALGLRDRIFHDLTVLLERVPVFQLSRSRNLACIDEMVQVVLTNRQEASLHCRDAQS